MKLKWVAVSWQDAACGLGWREHDPKNHGVKAIPAGGIMVEKNSKYLKLAFSYDKESNNWLGSFEIPIAMVKKIRVIHSEEI